MFGFQRFDKEVAAKLERLDTLSTHCGVGRGMPCCTKATPCIPKHAGPGQRSSAGCAATERRRNSPMSCSLGQTGCIRTNIRRFDVKERSPTAGSVCARDANLFSGNRSAV